MKGAAPVPPARSNAPIKRKAKRIGKSHHFLFSFRKTQNSLKNPPPASAACFSKSDGLFWFINFDEDSGWRPFCQLRSSRPNFHLVFSIAEDHAHSSLKLNQSESPPRKRSGQEAGEKPPNRSETSAESVQQISAVSKRARKDPRPRAAPRESIRSLPHSNDQSYDLLNIQLDRKRPETRSRRIAGAALLRDSIEQRS